MASKVRVYGKAQNRTALGIAHAYMVMYPQATLEDLRKAFPNELNPDKGVKENFVYAEDKGTTADWDGYFKAEEELLTMGDELSEKAYESAINVLSGGFMNTQSEKKKFADIDILKYDAGQAYTRLFSYYQGAKKLAFTQQMSDLINLGICRYRDIYSKNQDEMGFSLYQKYSRKDACRILNWERDDSSTVYGYKIKNGTCPIFVTYEKKEDISSSTKYEDEFIANNIFSWMTRSRVSINSEEAQKLIHYKENGLKILLFIKKSDGEGSDFYYMGLVNPIYWEQTEISDDKGKKLPIMNFHLQLENSVRDDIYDYIVNQ